jgi:hypothetical protein
VVNHVVVCDNPATLGNEAKEFGHPEDGSWHNLGDPTSSTDVFWHCVSQVA